MPATRLAPFTSLLLVSAISAQAHWTLLYPAQSPPGREDHAMVFHASTGRVVMFGGRHNSTFYGDTWVLDGSSWSQLAVAGPQDPRQGHAMAADVARGELLLFGGSTGSGGPLQDTWKWNGVGWTQPALSVRPAGRTGAAIAYDPVRQRVVLFGGNGGSSSIYDDTWEWDGLAWTQAAPAIAPPARTYAAMAFDPTLGEVLMFGGGGSNLPPLIDTWSWDGVVWTWHQVGNLPPRRSGHGMVSDAARQRVVMWGGTNWDAHVWQWDGTGWTAAFLLPPTPRYSPAMAYDAANARIVMFGGDGGFNDTWTFATDDLASYETIGAGCIGTTGTPELHNAPYSLPWIGDTFDIRCHLVPFNTPVIFATGYEAPGPTALGLFGMPGCTLHVTVLETQFRLSDPTGTAHWSLHIPNATSLAGVELAQQALVLDPPVNAAGAVVSTAGKFTIGIR